MENFFDILIPILVFVFYFFSIARANAEKKKKKQQQQDQGGNQAQLTRKIQEEIRRKIRERTHQTGEYVYDPTKPDYAQGPRMHRSDAEYEPYDEDPGFYEETEEVFGPFEEPEPEPTVYQEPGRPAAPAAVRMVDALQAQLERVRETEAQAERAKQERYAKMAQAWHPSLHHSHIAMDSATRRKRLRNPQAAREAYINLEIFGTPKGLRQDDAIQPAWR